MHRGIYYFLIFALKIDFGSLVLTCIHNLYFEEFEKNEKLSTENHHVLRFKNRCILPRHVIVRPICRYGLTLYCRQVDGCGLWYQNIMTYYKNLTWMSGTDRQICPKGHCFGITKQGPEGKIVDPYLTLMIDFFLCTLFLCKRFN